MYKLSLTTEDLNSIAHVGGRYEWSRSVLFYLEEGENEIAEAMAWEINDAFKRDTEGGHSMFPMLDPASDLYAKLSDFHDSII